MADRVRSLLVRFLGDSSSLDKETNGIVGRLGKIKTAVGEADGFFGKLKAGGGAALESVGGAGVVAGAGITAAAVAAGKGLLDFQRLGVEVGKGADATGLSYEAFSRWKEVADDAGVSGEAFEGTVGKFNKTLGASPGLLAAYGVEIVKAKDGTTDVNATFLNAIQTVNGIEGPTKRAEAAARLFGRGWQSMAELIARGAPQLRSDLAAVDDAKVFDQSKVNDARNLRDAFDSIKDAGEELFLTLGQTLAPVVVELAPQVAKVVEQVKPLASGLGDLLSGVLNLVGPVVDLANKLTGPLAEGLGKVASLVGDVVGGLGNMIENATGDGEVLLGLVDAVGDHVAALADGVDDGAASEDLWTDAVKAAQDAADAAVKTVEDLIQARKDLIESTLSSIDAEYDYMNQAVESNDAVAAYNEVLADTESTEREKFDATEKARQSLVDTAKAYAEASGEAEGTDGYIKAMIDSLVNQAITLDPNSPLRVALDGYIAQLRGIPTTVETDFRIKGDSVVVNGRQIAVGARSAAGGPVPAGVPRLVGEHGAEVFTPMVDGVVTPNWALGGARAARPAAPQTGGDIHVHIAGNVYGVDEFERAVANGARAALAEMQRQQRGNL